MRRAGAGKVNVVSLAAHQQTLAQTLAIIDNLPPGPALLAIGLTPMRFTTSPATDAGLLSGRPILVHSPRLAQLAPRLYGRGSPFWGVLPGIFDYAGAYLRVRAADGPFWGVRIPYAHHYYPPAHEGRSAAGQTAGRSSRCWPATSGCTRRTPTTTSPCLREILRLAQERGFAVVFWDQPLNASAAGPDWGGVVPEYRRRAEALAAQ